MTDPAILRILDAAANRAREALRVLEDYARFALDDPSLTAQLKSLRHDLAAALAPLPMAHALQTRDTPHDVGTTIKTPAEHSRENLADILTANAKRLTEALRSLEECSKTLQPNGGTAAAKIESLRYQAYTLEKNLLQSLPSQAQSRFRQVRLYILLTDSLCHPTLGGWEKALDLILSAKLETRNSKLETPHLAIQLREKSLPDAELLRRAKILAEKCRNAGALSIINDRPDIALLAHADGVHLGQSDLPPAEARKILGPDPILGLSTENLDQAHQAQRDGATYIALGPMFSTATKQKSRIAGPQYAAQALAQIRTPLVAIGGITPQNLPQLTSLGIRCIAVSSAILSHPNPPEIIANFLSQIPPDETLMTKSE